MLVLTGAGCSICAVPFLILGLGWTRAWAVPVALIAVRDAIASATGARSDDGLRGSPTGYPVRGPVISRRRYRVSNEDALDLFPGPKCAAISIRTRQPGGIPPIQQSGILTTEEGPIKNKLCLVLATCSLLGMSACSSVSEPGSAGMAAAPASATAQAAPKRGYSPWDYQSYPFGE